MQPGAFRSPNILAFLSAIYNIYFVIMHCSLKKFLLLFGFLYLLSKIRAQENQITCGRRRVKSVYFIHNGIDAKAGHWPWHAAIFHQTAGRMDYACGGSILDQNTILTGKMYIKYTYHFTRTHWNRLTICYKHHTVYMVAEVWSLQLVYQYMWDESILRKQVNTRRRLVCRK